MKKWTSSLFTLISYVTALLSLVFFFDFTAGSFFGLIPQDAWPRQQLGQIFLFDGLLLLLLGLQLSDIGRETWKRWLSLWMPTYLIRSHNVLTSALVVLILTQAWVPSEQALWQVSSSWLRYTLLALHLLGWGLILWCAFHIDHLDLLGLRPLCRMDRDGDVAPYFTRPFLHRYVRHPLMTGSLLVFWTCTPLTLDRLLLAVAMTGYALMWVWREERDVQKTGHTYLPDQPHSPRRFPILRRKYKKQTSQPAFVEK